MEISLKKIGNLHKVNGDEGTIIAEGETFNQEENKKKLFKVALNKENLSLSIIFKNRAWTVFVEELFYYASTRSGIFCDKVKVEGEMPEVEQ